jgi:hypothetical protein
MNNRKSMPTMKNPDNKVIETLASIEANKPFAQKEWAYSARPNYMTENFLPFTAKVKETESSFVCIYKAVGVPGTEIKAFHKLDSDCLKNVDKFFQNLRVCNPMERN